jgi:D-sedoheptulose 7-phosphate isomerase
MSTDPITAHLLRQRLQGAERALASLYESLTALDAICTAVVETLVNDGTLYTCGNGGSAAQASHLSEELIGRYRSDRPACRAVCLNADPAALTCIANDFGFDEVFARQAGVLCGGRDALVALSTSGESPNIVAALRAARERGATVIGLLGRDGGAALELCDHAVVVPGEESAHIQEAHQVVVHLICEAVERRFAAVRQ